MLSIGSDCPTFNVKDESRNNISSLDLRGINFVLYFYPKDDTPGCTIEANDFNKLKLEFEKLDCKIFGVSKDGVKSHKSFKEKYCLNFPLILDEDSKLCQTFNVMKEKSMFGKKYVGISRDTFLIDRGGRINFIWRNVSANGHANDVLTKLKLI